MGHSCGHAPHIVTWAALQIIKAPTDHWCLKANKEEQTQSITCQGKHEGGKKTSLAWTVLNLGSRETPTLSGL